MDPESGTNTDPTMAIGAADPKKRRKRRSKNLTVSQYTIRDPEWAYLHLQHFSQTPKQTALDDVTVHMQLTAALSQFLGLHGQAIPVDVLKLDGSDLWIRIPNQDRAGFTAAAGGWVGRNDDAWRVKGWSSWDARARNRDTGQDLFND